jgi:hypothetical protein
MTKLLSECFEGAAVLLKEKGWVQRVLKDEKTGAHCMIGACRAICPDTPDSTFAEGLGWKDTTRRVATTQAYNYNDRRGQSAGIVIARLRKAAAIQRKKEAQDV